MVYSKGLRNELYPFGYQVLIGEEETMHMVGRERLINKHAEIGLYIPLLPLIL